jgi:hypothetical protein
LIVSSIDGYCTLVSFNGNELGELHPDQIQQRNQSNSFVNATTAVATTTITTAPTATPMVVDNV